MKQKISFALDSFKNIHEIIRFVDQKAGALLVVAGFIITALVSNTGNFVAWSKLDESILIIPTGIGSLLAIIYAIYVVLFEVLKVRLAGNYRPGECSLFYFEHLSQISRAELSQKYEELTEETMLANVIDQQHELSKILQKKVNGLSKAINQLFISTILLVGCLITAHVFAS